MKRVSATIGVNLGKQALAVAISAVAVASQAGGQCSAIVGSVEFPGYAFDVAVSGDLAYVAATSSGLQVVDVGRAC